MKIPDVNSQPTPTSLNLFNCALIFLSPFTTGPLATTPDSVLDEMDISRSSDGLSSTSSVHILYAHATPNSQSVLDEMHHAHHGFNFIAYNSNTNHRIDERELDNDFTYDPTEPLPVLPFIKNRAHGIPINNSPQYADNWPLGFTRYEWMRIWHSQPCCVDQYLQHEQLFCDGPLLPWVDEYAYKGATYSLTIDARKSLIGLPILTHGTVISVGIVISTATLWTTASTKTRTTPI